jgi:hypothetical protein
MRRILFVLFLFAVKFLPAQIMFEKTLADTVSISASSAEPLSGGGYIACGSVRGATRYNAMLMRLDSGGNILWTKTYSSYVDLFGMDVHPVSTGGYILLAQKQQTTAFEAQVIRTDSSGNVLWQQSYGGPGREEVQEIVETSDGGFLISIQSDSYGNNMCAALIKTDASGIVQWRKNYRGNRGAVGCSAKEVPTGGYILTARIVDSIVGYVNDIMVVRVDAGGNLVWSTTFGGSNSDEPTDLEIAPDNGCYVAGRLYGYGPGSSDVFLSRLDSAGNLLWTKTYGGPASEHTFDMDITSDSGVIIGAWTSSFSSSVNDYYLIRTDPNGDTLWTSISNSGTNGGHFLWNIAQTSDGGFMCAGEAYMTINSQYVMFLVKTDANGATLCNQQGTATTVTNVTLPITNLNVNVISGNAVVTTAITVGTCVFSDTTYCTNVGIHETSGDLNVVSIYPCPSNTTITVTTSRYMHSAHLTIYNSCGEVTGMYENINGPSASVDCHSLPCGIYFIAIDEEGLPTLTKSFIVADQ